MGICYTLLLQDDFDFTYVGEDKSTRIERLINELEQAGVYAYKFADWYGWAVIDLDKRDPRSPEIYNIVKRYCDGRYFIDDLRNVIQKLEPFKLEPFG